jgi:hypothetical protein
MVGFVITFVEKNVKDADVDINDHGNTVSLDFTPMTAQANGRCCGESNGPDAT